MALDDACTLLDEDHNQVARLFQRYKQAHQDNEQRVLAQQICQALRVHTQIEEEIFYPAFRNATRDEALIEESTHEHQEAAELIDRIEQAPTDARLMLELEDAVLHHINDEREKMFPQARKAQGMDLARLARELDARKQELMAGHPA